MAMDWPLKGRGNASSDDVDCARTGPRIGEALPGQAEHQGVELRTAQHQ